MSLLTKASYSNEVTQREQENLQVAYRAACEGIVLLKNDGTLPFSKNLHKVAVIGPFAKEKGIKGNWAGNGRDEDCVTVLAGVRALLPDAEVAYTKGCSWELADVQFEEETGLIHYTWDWEISYG